MDPFRLLLLALPLTGWLLTCLSCRVIPEGLRLGYRVEDGQVVQYRGFPAHRTAVPGADARTFRSINSEYGKDKTHVFLNGEVVRGADPSTFVVLGPGGGNYARDAKHGFWAGKIISDDGANFDIVPNPEEKPGNVSVNGIRYARDRTRVYEFESLVPGADPATFEFIPMYNGQFLARDRKAVYHKHRGTVPLEGVDSASFQKLNDVFFRDSRGVWGIEFGKDTQFRKLEGADPATFLPISRFYGKDKSHVFRETRVVAGADPSTFRPPHKQ